MAFFEERIEKGLIAKLTAIVKSEFARMDYTEAIAVLERSKQKFEFPVAWGIDLQSEHERYLTEKHVGRPVIVTGTSILTGPIAGAALGLALASPIIAWGLWMLKRWAPQRTLLLEIMSLVIGVLAFTQADINRMLLLTLIGCAILILLCWFADPGVRAITTLRQGASRAARKQA